MKNYFKIKRYSHQPSDRSLQAGMDSRVSHVLGTMMELISTQSSLGRGRGGKKARLLSQGSLGPGSVPPSIHLPSPGWRWVAGGPQPAWAGDPGSSWSPAAWPPADPLQQEPETMATGGLFGRGLPFWGSSRPSHLPNTRMQALHRLTTHDWRRQDLAIYTVMLFIPHDKPDLQVLGSAFCR